MAEEDHSGEEVGPEQDILYVAQDELASVKAKLKDSKEITKDDVDKLVWRTADGSPENLPDDAMMVPVDMRGVEEEFADVEEMVAKLGAKGTAEAFVKARDFFEKNKGDGECAQPMTAKEWTQVLGEDAAEEAIDLTREMRMTFANKEELAEGLGFATAGIRNDEKMIAAFAEAGIAEDAFGTIDFDTFVCTGETISGETISQEHLFERVTSKDFPLTVVMSFSVVNLRQAHRQIMDMLANVLEVAGKEELTWKQVCAETAAADENVHSRGSPSCANGKDQQKDSSSSGALSEDWVLLERPCANVRLVTFMRGDYESEREGLSTAAIAATAGLSGAAGLLLVGPWTAAFVATLIWGPGLAAFGPPLEGKKAQARRRRLEALVGRIHR